MTANYNTNTAPIEGNTGYPDGYYVGKASTDKISFYGVAPVVQPTGIADATAITAASAVAVSGGFGFSTSAQANAAVSTINTLVSNQNALLAKLEALGLLATA